MDIAAMSMSLSQMQLSQEVGTSVLKMAMDNSKEMMNDMTKMMEQTMNPHIGGNIDIKL